jgi:ribosomal protein S18 acetylase RimI-like enzyme
MLSESLEDYWLQVLSSFSKPQQIEGATVTCYPKVLLPVINHAACINTQTDGTTLITEIEELFRSKQVPFSCFRLTPLTQPATFASLLQDKDYKVEGGKQSVMIRPQTNIPKSQSSPVQIRTVANDSDVDLFGQLMTQIFEMPPQWKASFDQFTKDCIAGGWQFYRAYLEGKAVGTCALFCSGGFGGIFDVGTLPECRGQGIGSALTLRAIADSVASGNGVLTLQAETGGNAERLYQKLGFTTDHTVQFYIKQV